MLLQSKMLYLLACSLVISACAADNSDPSLFDSESGFNTPSHDWEPAFWENDSERGQPETQPRHPSGPRSQPHPDGPDEFLSNIALIVPADDTNPASHAREAIADLAPGFGFRLLPRSQVEETISRAPDCTNVLSIACATELSQYPGARLLIFLGTGNGKPTATILDASTGASYLPVELSEEKLPESLLQLAQERAAVGEWVLRPFIGDDGRLYVSAGQQNGLKKGSRFSISEPGQLVRSPAGVPVAWRKGSVIGKAEVLELVGENLAIISGLEGAKPTPDHELTHEGKP